MGTWNNLPGVLAKTDAIEALKKLLNKHMGMQRIEGCGCSSTCCQVRHGHFRLIGWFLYCTVLCSILTNSSIKAKSKGLAYPRPSMMLRALLCTSFPDAVRAVEASVSICRFARTCVKLRIIYKMKIHKVLEHLSRAVEGNRQTMFWVDGRE